MLIDAGVRSANGKLSDKQALQQSLKNSAFKSVRSDFKFGNNQNPIQTFYLRQIVKDEKGNIYNKIVSTLSQSHVDQYANQCKMK
jgi:branched-chain amino acid transport system substrate-binding protein